MKSLTFNGRVTELTRNHLLCVEIILRILKSAIIPSSSLIIKLVIKASSSLEAALVIHIVHHSFLLGELILIHLLLHLLLQHHLLV